MNIISKFALATDESTDTLLNLIIELASEKFGPKLETQQLNEFIEKYYNRKYFVSEMNSMSNQWIMVYVDNQAVGYARVTSRGKVPPAIDSMRAVRIGDFSILEKFRDSQIMESLYDKCISLCRHVDAIWINEYIDNPFIEFFESKGFIKQPGMYELDDIGLPSSCLIFKNRSH